MVASYTAGNTRIDSKILLSIPGDSGLDQQSGNDISKFTWHHRYLFARVAGQ